MTRFIQWLRCAQAHAHAYHKAYHRAHHVTHVSYLVLVVGHGPYTVAAGAMLVVVIVGYLLKLEEI